LKDSTNKIVINPKSIVRLLASVATVLIILSLITQLIAFETGHPSIHGLVPFFNLDEEHNLPTFFSGLILLFASFLLALIYILKRKEKDRIYWALLSLGFLYMTFDEMFMFHERFVGPNMKRILGDNTTGIFHYAWLIWVIPIGIIVIILFFIFFKFLNRLPSKTRLAFFAAGFMYVGAAIGIELIEGYISLIYGEYSLINTLVCAVQESIEMYAVIFFIWSLLDYFANHYKKLYFRFSYLHNMIVDHSE
jgi:hypothetical protein